MTNDIDWRSALQPQLPPPNGETSVRKKARSRRAWRNGTAFGGVLAVTAAMFSFVSVINTGSGEQAHDVVSNAYTGPQISLVPEEAGLSGAASPWFVALGFYLGIALFCIGVVTWVRRLRRQGVPLSSVPRLAFLLTAAGGLLTALSLALSMS